MFVRIASTGDTWNSKYTLEDIPLSTFLADFARIPEHEALEISERVFEQWARSGERSEPSVRTEAPKAVAALAPAVGLVVLVVVAVLAILAYVFLHAVGLW
jgi:hypothetical protein